MNLAITVIVGLIVILIIFACVRRYFVRRITRRLQEDAQRQTDRAMSWALDQLVAHEQLTPDQRTTTHSKEVANVWGRGVMAFEYVIEDFKGDTNEAKKLRTALSRELQAYADANQVRSSVSDVVFEVSDLWQHEDRLHLDVAYLMNEPTVEYLEDLKKLDDKNELP
ncbi:putative membrane protein [Secundilactobacillus oryzae JCM 18671]|uniref:Putative membrane protein n=1 Tax=Secundilactobacillus oryzae JCM 18671 TaxID=1291743 RepID=A0A081BGR1_9LACO|nr:hypothetical protein [Secundilactobacillus oryzae]GAK47229.1 putative membrane protein [Secundilactobacillus oryzae JCM 18671]